MGAATNPGYLEKVGILTLEPTARINARSERKIIAVYNSALDKTLYL